MSGQEIWWNEFFQDYAWELEEDGILGKVGVLERVRHLGSRGAEPEHEVTSFLFPLRLPGPLIMEEVGFGTLDACSKSFPGWTPGRDSVVSLLWGLKGVVNLSSLHQKLSLALSYPGEEGELREMGLD